MLNNVLNLYVRVENLKKKAIQNLVLDISLKALGYEKKYIFILYLTFPISYKDMNTYSHNPYHINNQTKTTFQGN